MQKQNFLVCLDSAEQLLNNTVCQNIKVVESVIADLDFVNEIRNIVEFEVLKLFDAQVQVASLIIAIVLFIPISIYLFYLLKNIFYKFRFFYED